MLGVCVVTSEDENCSLYLLTNCGVFKSRMLSFSVNVVTSEDENCSSYLLTICGVFKARMLSKYVGVSLLLLLVRSLLYGHCLRDYAPHGCSNNN